MLSNLRDRAASAASGLISKAKNLSRGAVVGATIAVGAVATSPALAATPPTMPAIELPIDLASVAAAVAVVGGTMLLAWAGIFIGFRLARKFIARAGKTV